ncbi:MAG: Cof-type HAD-IIB family hydrolase [Candidatus Izemoplasmataceae bacterium]
MNKKYIFLDLDGTLIDHESNDIPKSTEEAIEKAQAEGHELFICTGRIPALFKGIEKRLNIHNYIAANGKLVVLHDNIIRNEFMNEDYVDEFVQYIYQKKIDVAFETPEAYVLNSHFSSITDKFLDTFHLGITKVQKDYHKKHKVYQMNLMYIGDYSDLEDKFPYFHFSQANEFGLDVVQGNGMKEQGVRAVVDQLKINLEDTIAFGDGYNDISMIEYVHTGVAMGNANDALKEKADFVTDDVTNDGIFNAFVKLGLIKK